MRPWAALLVAAVAALADAALDPAYFLARPGHCMASAEPPTSGGYALELCRHYNKRSCCTPGNDAVAKEEYLKVVNLGPGCAFSHHTVRAVFKEVKDFVCMGCDPAEPTYRFPSRTGDGMTPPDPTAGPKDFTWRICSSFLVGPGGPGGDRGLWGKDGEKFSRCGVAVEKPCDAPKQVGYDSRGQRFVSSAVATMPADWNDGCGSEVINPAAAFGPNATRLGAATALLRRLPQWLPGFRFVVVNDTGLYNRSAFPCFAAAGPLPWAAAALVAALHIALAVL